MGADQPAGALTPRDEGVEIEDQPQPVAVPAPAPAQFDPQGRDADIAIDVSLCPSILARIET